MVYCQNNWETTGTAISKMPRITCYAGVGGDVWPLDQSNDPYAMDLQYRFMKSRVYVKLPDGKVIFVCTDINIARDYWECAEVLLGDCFLISSKSNISLDVGSTGWDYGNPTGGYSIIESEILTPQNGSLAADYLNEYGLFRNLETMKAYIENDRASIGVEDLSECVPLGISVVKKPSRAKK